MNEDYINHLTAKYAAALQNNKVAGMIQSQSPSPAVSAAIDRIKTMPAGPELEAAKLETMQGIAERGGFAGPGNYLTDRDVDMSGTRLMSLNPLTAVGDLWTDSNRLAGGRSSVSMQNSISEGATNLLIPALLAGGIGAAGTRIGSPLSNAAGLGYNPFTPLALQSEARQQAHLRANLGIGEGMGLGKELANVHAVPVEPRSFLGALWGKTQNTTGAGGDLKITQQSAIDPKATHPVRLIDKKTNLEIGTLNSGRSPYFDVDYSKPAPPRPTNEGLTKSLVKGIYNKATLSNSRATKVGLIMGLLQLAYGATRNYEGSEDPNASSVDKVLGRHEVDISGQDETDLAAVNNVRGSGN